MRQRIVAAMTSGAVPDVLQNNPAEIIALYAWNDMLVDLSDVVETQREEYTETALLTVRCYNNVEKKRSIYGVTNHVWRSLVEQAGYKMADIRKNWDAFYDFFKGVQKALREQGMRHVYGLGFQLTTNGGDCNSFFNQFLVGYGVRDIVTKDGKLHLDDRRCARRRSMR
jgi:multiple sugar transport system substrate-binding protein